MAAIGKHLILELNDCDRDRLSDRDFLKDTLLSACRVSGATILSESFHSFSPYGGVSGVVIIAESHFSVHTWPEYGYAAIDIFTCGNSIHPQKAVDLLVRELQARDHSILELNRGNFEPPGES
ncbi:MAG TPA: adenosylmethionine decarboxylase [Dehalococcoidia bacterium]|nr:adenosylmethionine decarboxylase [Dehalococcoidia bacterium]